MWAKALKYLAEFLLLPLLMEGAIFLREYVKDWFDKRKRKKDNEKRKKDNERKANAHANSSVDDSGDTFRELP